MGEHTPGPWQVHGSHIYTADPERALLAQVHNPGSRRDDYPLKANAHLIAAAPDLLEACKEFVRKVDAGEARSARSYYEMKAAIEKAHSTQNQAQSTGLPG